MKRVAVVIGGTLAVWLAAVGAIQALGVWRETTLAYSGLAAGLCLIPTVAILLGSEWTFRQSPDQQLLVVLGGTGFRLVTVLLGAWVLLHTEFGGELYFQKQSGFWMWILVFYLVTLALEITVVVMKRGPAISP